MITEAFLSKHYIERKQERIPPLKAWASDVRIYGDYDVSQTNEKVKALITEEILLRLESLETKDFNISRKGTTVKIVLIPRLSRGDKSVPLTISDGKYEGVCYYIVVEKGENNQVVPGGVFVTIMIGGRFKNNYKLDKTKIADEVIDHAKRRKKDYGTLHIIGDTDFFLIDIDELWGKATKKTSFPEWNEDDYNFKPAADYKKNGLLTFKVMVGGKPEWRTRKIVNNSASTLGQKDGHLDWVEVIDPHVSKGTHNMLRRINNVKTKSYFGIFNK